MSMLLKINNFIAVFLDALKALFYVRLWTPFFIMFLISIALAYMILHPFSGPWSDIIIALGKIKLFGGGAAFVHYPQHLIIAPGVYSRLSIPVILIFDSLLSGTAFIIFAGFFSGEKSRFGTAVKNAFSRYHYLIIANLIIYVVLLAIQLTLPGLFIQSLKGNPRQMFAFITLFKGFMFLVLSPFVYMIPYLILGNESIPGALVKSFKTFIRNFFTTFFAVAISQGIVLPFSLAMDFGIFIADKFSPETVSLLFYLEIVATMLASFIFTAMITRFYTEYHE